MILTEQEAKGKVCPLLSYRSRGHDESAYSYCIASGCMKWRWDHDKAPEEIEARRSWQGDAVPVPKGYCGA